MKRVLASVVVALVLAGCGGSPSVVTIADRAPALAERLDRIDAALVDQRYAEARKALRALIAQTRNAQRAGDIDAATAADILAAARKLLALLPTPAEEETEVTAGPQEAPSEKPSRQPTAQTTDPEPTTSPTAPEPTPEVTEEPVEPSPSAEPSAEPSREATPTEQASPVALAP